MHLTKMHIAFLQSKSVDTKTHLGRLVLDVAQRHHAQMIRETTEYHLRQSHKQWERNHNETV